MSYPGSWIDGSHGFRTRNGEITLWVGIPTFSYDQLDGSTSTRRENNPIKSLMTTTKKKESYTINQLTQAFERLHARP